MKLYQIIFLWISHYSNWLLKQSDNKHFNYNYSQLTRLNSQNPKNIQMGQRYPVYFFDEAKHTNANKKKGRPKFFVETA